MAHSDVMSNQDIDAVVSNLNDIYCLRMFKVLMNNNGNCIAQCSFIFDVIKHCGKKNCQNYCTLMLHLFRFLHLHTIAFT